MIAVGAVRLLTVSTESTTFGPGPPALAAPAAPQFGANVNYLFNEFDLTPAQISAQLGVLAGTGATLARSDALWEASEPSRGHFEWAFDDEIAGLLAVHHLQWLPIIDYTVSWDQSIGGQDHSPPASDADYAAYARALAARYGAGGGFWREHPQIPAEPVETYEIWNEPDNAVFWVPASDPAAYAALYTAARDEIKRVQPGARVIVGGLVDPGPFLTGMLDAEPGLRTRIDGVAIHPYGSDPAKVLGRVIEARQALIALGLQSTPLYVTEFGWTTEPAGTPGYAAAATRPAYIERALTGLGELRCGLGAVLLYTWSTPDSDPADSQDWYGIDPPGGGGPDVDAFAAGLRAGGHPSTLLPCA